MADTSTTDTDPLDALLQEVASRHGLQLSRDDPLLVLHTLNQRLLHDSRLAQQAQLEHYRQELESLTLRWGSDAKERAQKTLQAALTAGQATMEQALEHTTRNATSVLHTEMTSTLERIAALVQDARRVAMLNVLAACLVCTAAALALWAWRG